MADELSKNSWISEIEQSRNTSEMTTWNRACNVIRRQYRYEDSARSNAARRYAMLWSNIEVLKGAVYSKPPKADVTRRYRDKDPTARQASEMLERGIDFQSEGADYDSKYKQVREDFLLYARGQARVIYEPEMQLVASDNDTLDGADAQGPKAEAAHEQAAADPDDATEGASEEAGEQEPPEVVKFEWVRILFVQREDFAHSRSRVWEEVTWVAFRAFLSRDELRKRFKEKLLNGTILGDVIPLSASTDRPDSNIAVEADENKAIIWEVWDKVAKKVRWVAEGWPDVLEESDPYLQLQGFFPCPRPAYGTQTNDTLIPRPDYVFYQDQAEEINSLTRRIASLEEALKLVGFYPAGPSGEGFPEIERAANPTVSNKMIAVKSWAAFTDGSKGGVPIVWWPVEQVVKVLEGCVKLRAQLIEDVYQITGISDILRGSTDPDETKGAQVLKTQHGGMRLKNRQEELARFCRDIQRLVGEIICQHFQPETIMAMSNTPLPTDQQVLEQLRQQQEQALIAQAQQQRQQAMQQQAPPPGAGGPPMAMQGAPA